MGHGEERRRHRRYGVTFTAQALEGSKPFATVEIINASESGLGIVTMVPMRPDERYRFAMQGWNDEPLDGIVRWSEIGDVRTYAGIEFIAISEKQAAALQSLIALYDRQDWGG